jgi:hypothetical protein
MESTGLPKSELEAGEAGWFQNSHALSAQSLGRSAARNRLWVGGSSKGLADSNGEFSLIESEDRPFGKAQRTTYPESQRLCHPPLTVQIPHGSFTRCYLRGNMSNSLFSVRY